MKFLMMIALLVPALSFASNCDLVDQKESSLKETRLFLKASASEFENAKTGIWYNDFASSNYVVVHFGKDNSDSVLFRVKLSSNCEVKDISLAQNPELLNYLLDVESNSNH